MQTCCCFLTLRLGSFEAASPLPVCVCVFGGVRTIKLCHFVICKSAVAFLSLRLGTSEAASPLPACVCLGVCAHLSCFCKRAVAFCH